MLPITENGIMKLLSYRERNSEMVEPERDGTS